jgi:hypothetical protein
MSNQWRPSSRPSMQHRDARPIKEPGAFGSRAHREALPLLVLQQEGFHFPGFHPSASSLSSHDPNGFITGDRQHVGRAMGLQPGAQVQVPAIHAISHHPGNGDLSLEDPLEHLHRQFRFGLEAHRCRDARLLTPLQIFCPIEGKREFAVDERMAFGCDVGEKDADLTVLHLSGGPAILHLDPCRLLPAFGETAFINHHNGGFLPKVFQGLLTEVVTHAVRVPDRLREQALHAIGVPFSGLLGQMPAIFARAFTQETLQVGQSTPTRFWSGKARSNARIQLGERLRPLHNLRRVVLAPVKVICWGCFMVFSF